MITNIQRDALPSACTPEDLSLAMQALDLSAVPPSKRGAAIFDRLMHVMGNTLNDQSQRTEVLAARVFYHAKHG